MKKLTKEQVLMIHSELIRETGGSDGLRDDGLLDSALNAPFQGFGDVDIFPSLQQKGARLGYGLICNHAFVDGNKRIGAHIMLLFLSLNGIELTYTQEELSDMVMDVASSKLRFEDVVEWIIKHQD
jgi:death-on-curing protein